GGGPGPGIVHGGAGHELTRLVVHELFAERLADALGEGAVDLSLYDHGVDDGPAVLDDRVVPHGDATRLGVHLHVGDVDRPRERGGARVEGLRGLEARLHAVGEPARLRRVGRTRALPPVDPRPR